MRLSSPEMVLSIALVLGLVACENWPLYSHLPDPEMERPPVPALVVQEGAANLTGSPQSLGLLAGSQRLIVEGRIDSCGYDVGATGVSWPEHPVDEDGDGSSDATRARVGWYTGEVDTYSVAASVALRISAELRWSEAPKSGLNSPYRPSDPSGAWATESDLDLLLYRFGGAVEVPVLSGDEGVSRRHPELLPAGLTLSEGQSVAVAVACHHALPSNYELTLVATAL